MARQFDKEERDLLVLRVVIEHQPIGINRLASETGLDEHEVRYSLRMLEEDELVEPTPKGAVPVDDIGERIGEINDGLEGLIERLNGLKTSWDE